MTLRPTKILFTFFALLLFTSAWNQENDFDSTIKNTKKTTGFFNFYTSQDEAQILLEIDKLDEEFLYYSSLPHGVGSNDIGLDRGRIGQGKVVKFVRSGNKLLLQQPNYRYRASSSDKLEQKAVEESFATSILFGFPIVAEKNGKYLVDLTPFLLRDGVDAALAIKRTGQGTYAFDASRSGLFLENSKSFPKNTEFEAIITLSGADAGGYLRSVTPTPDHVTMHQHHSFVQLPEPGFKTREFDPRMGYFGPEFLDYSSAISEPIAQKLISRHRLIKKNPNQEISEPVEPIVYYIDSGVPEPIRSALFEGATWWEEAFEAAGFKNAYQVKMLPEDADPMDIRYNIVQWVHRSTRGWSYGGSISDPRTGEILKAKVTLVSLRVRQDYMIAQGLAANFDENQEQPELTQMALDRLKQLSAHEIGHTLGIAHNFIASTESRASVMDYPFPFVTVKDGKIDFSEAYDMGIGDFDKLTVNWGYREFSNAEEEKEELNKIIEEGKQKYNYKFLSDSDARPLGSIHPQNHLWDNGLDATQELERIVNLRNQVLQDFNLSKLPEGQPISTLEEVLVPIYMLHRFQLEAAAKSIAGAYYSYSVKDGNDEAYRPVSAGDQQKALEAVLATLDADFLKLPPQLLTQIPPRAYRYPANERETFKRRTGLSFDPLAPAEASAQLAFSLLLNEERLSRLAGQSGLDKNLPSATYVLDRITQKLWKSKGLTDATYEGQINRQTAMMYLTALLNLSATDKISFEAKIAVLEALEEIKEITKSGKGINLLARTWITEFERDPTSFSRNQMLFTPPDGQPIDEEYNWLRFED